MDTDSEKITIRISKKHLKAIDFLVRADDFPSRSEAIRTAVRDMVYARVEMVPEKLKKIKDAEIAVANAEVLERDIIKR
jgi:Arc/MetJ-type ribon-helix-helix transcriptional regulator